MQLAAAWAFMCGQPHKICACWLFCGYLPICLPVRETERVAAEADITMHWRRLSWVCWQVGLPGCQAEQ